MNEDKEKPKDEIRCSYCGKPRSEVSKLVSGPSVYICDQCVWLCVHVIVEEGMKDRIDTLDADLKSERDRADKAEARIAEHEAALDAIHEALCRKCDDTDPTEMIALACARIQSCSDLESERAEIVEACGFEDDVGDTNRPSTLVAYIAEQQKWALEKCDRTIDLMHARAWRDNLRTTKARVAELEGPHEWPSIESAPEDGTRVLIYDPKTTDACRCLVAWMGPGPHGDEEWLYWEGPLCPSFESVWTHLPVIESSDDDETPS